MLDRNSLIPLTYFFYGGFFMIFENREYNIQAQKGHLFLVIHNDLFKIVTRDGFEMVTIISDDRDTAINILKIL